MAQIIAGGTKPDSGGNVEVITQTQTTTWTQLQGKPYIAVSSKGIVNGLSTIPNDGADFGPDTTKGATAPGQYGSPYTVSVGLQESVNYVYNKKGGRIFIKNGHYVISAYSQGLYSQGGIVIPYTPATDAPIPIQIEGESSIFAIYQGSTSGVSGNGPGLTPMGTNGVVIDISNLDNSSGQSLLTAAIVGDFDNGVPLNFSNTTVKIVNIATLNAASPSTCGFYFNNTSSAVLTDVVAGVVQTDTGYINSPNTNYTGGLTNTGIAMPRQTNAGGSVLDRAFVFGFFFGLGFASHFVGGVIMIMYCSQPVNVGAGHHTATILKLDIENSPSWFARIATPTHIVKLETQVISTQSTEWYNANVNELFVNPGSYTELLRIDELMYNNTSAGNIALPPQTNLDASDYANISIGIGTYSVNLSIPANPPVSGTTYQNTNLFDIRLKIPVTYSPTSSAAATLATGISSTSTVTTSTKVSYPAGITTGIIETYEMVVKAGQYFELVATNATIGTVEVQEA